MNKEIFLDEIDVAANKLATVTEKYLNPKKNQPKYTPDKYKNCFAVTDGKPFRRIIDHALNGVMKAEIYTTAHCDVKSIEELPDISSDTAILAYINAVNITEEMSQKWLCAAQELLKAAGKGNHNKVIFSVMMPEIPAFPSELTSMAEREYSYYIEKTIPETSDIKFYLQLEKLCRNAISEGFEAINILRLDNVFGPESNCIKGIDLPHIINDIFANKCVEITTEDYINNFSCTYIADACAAAFHAMYFVRNGHVYNVCSFSTNLAEIKNAVYMRFSDRLSLNSNCENVNLKQYTALNNLKFVKTGWKLQVKQLIDAVYRTVCNEIDEKYNVLNNLAVYSGRLNRLKDIEINVLKEIDKICSENNIQYFVAGGSLLGAIRNKTSIPWDDDLDIAMLREDFEKFRKICPKALSEQYIYSSPDTDPDVHYFFDKIRLDGTYFSTAYSGHFVYNDGVFVDIIVYDKTSNSKFFQKVHTKMMLGIIRAINIKWYNYSRRGVHYYLSKMFFPLLRATSWKTLHKISDKFLNLYTNRKNCKYLFDGVGQHIRNGGFPREWIETVEYSELDGLRVPIPTGYDNYLKFFYGDNYFEEPCLTKRMGAHKFSRLDIGEYIFETKDKADFRNVDVRGELFESEK